MILKSLAIDCEPVDIAGPGMDSQRDFMREKGKKKDGQRNVLPPQIFNEDDYCGVRQREKRKRVNVCLFFFVLRGSHIMGRRERGAYNPDFSSPFVPVKACLLYTSDAADE